MKHQRTAWQDHDLQDALGPESKGAGDHVISMKGVGTFRVADGHDSADEQRRLLARRTLAEVPFASSYQQQCSTSAARVSIMQRRELQCARLELS